MSPGSIVVPVFVPSLVYGENSTYGTGTTLYLFAGHCLTNSGILSKRVGRTTESCVCFAPEFAPKTSPCHVGNVLLTSVSLLAPPP